MTENSLVLTGVVRRPPRRTRSPAGVPHCHFMLEHRSLQDEAGRQRQAYCVMHVVGSGEDLVAQLAPIEAGQQVTVSGFIHLERHRNGEQRIVLHARHVEQV